jgi:hypothetical protein
MRASMVVGLLLPLAVALTVQPGWACPGGGKWACKQDIAQFCPDITPGPGSFKSIHDCLQQNAANLSPACQQQLTEMQAKVTALLQTCASDIQALCSPVASDTHATLKCLHQNRSSLSQACQDQLPSHHGKHHHGKECSPPADSGSANQ